MLHAKASTTTPTFGERHLSFTQADVMEAAGSRYGPTAPLIDVADVLDRGQPFAFIGKPCAATTHGSTSWSATGSHRCAAATFRPLRWPPSSIASTSIPPP